MADEIDLVDLLKKTVKTVTSNILALVITLVISVGTAYVVYFNSKSVYESKMIVRSDILTEPFTNSMAESVNDLIKTKNHNSLKEKLVLGDNDALALVEIKISSLKGEVKVKEEKEDLAFFLITIKVHNNTMLPRLQESLLNYLQNNEYVKVRIQLREEYYRQSIAKVDKEIQALDSLKSRITKGQPFSGNGSNMIFFDPTNVYSSSIELFKQKINLQQSLELVNSVQLIEGFTIPNRPIAPKLSVFLPVGFFAGLVLFGIFLMTKGVIWLSKQD